MKNLVKNLVSKIKKQNSTLRFAKLVIILIEMLIATSLISLLTDSILTAFLVYAGILTIVNVISLVRMNYVYNEIISSISIKK
jgi:hypothetical protein